jgi:hypothetical protein
MSALVRVLPLALVLASGCATTTTHTIVVASGDAVAALGKAFASADTKAVALHDAGALTDAQFASWRVFDARFRPAYYVLSDAWLAGANASDQTAAQSLLDRIAALAADLALASKDVLALWTSLHPGVTP